VAEGFSGLYDRGTRRKYSVALDESLAKEIPMSIVGAWKLTLETPFGVQTPSMRIDADGTGALITLIGEAPLTDLQVTEDTAEFTANVPTPMGNFSIGFSVKASGDALAGTFNSPLGATDFAGVREA